MNWKKLKISDRTKVTIVTSSIDQADLKKAKNYDVVGMYFYRPFLDLAPIQNIAESFQRANTLGKKRFLSLNFKE